MNVHVSNLSFAVQSEYPVKHFSHYREVSLINIITDKITCGSSGSAFTEMRENTATGKAVYELDGIHIDGAFTKVDEAGSGDERP